MPSKNSIKEYLENGYYHIYNRGVEKRNIFLDQQDYSVFLSYLKEYLTPKNKIELFQKISDPATSYFERDKFLKLLRLNNFSKKICLFAFALMSNHFHFLIKQTDPNAIDQFMNSIGTRYTMFFNRKYQRVGRLYQDVYKAVLVKSDEQLLHLSRYIHRQAISLQGDPLQEPLQEKYPSSYRDYLGQRKTKWLHPEEILSFFSNQNQSLTYESFVNQKENSELIGKLVIESTEE